jgi:hypothetical protein
VSRRTRKILGWACFGVFALSVGVLILLYNIAPDVYGTEAVCRLDCATLQTVTKHPGTAFYVAFVPPSAAALVLAWLGMTWD